ncbi:hypothetical protein FXO37_22560 [Capsicum annuum]|nr:hypothetical protein FXO37_22560 [Capsicum annuum]
MNEHELKLNSLSNAIFPSIYRICLPERLTKEEPETITANPVANIFVAKIQDFTRMNPPLFLGFKSDEDPQEFLDMIQKVQMLGFPIVLRLSSAAAIIAVVIDRIKKKLFGVIAITRKIIFEGGLVVVDDSSGSGAPLTVFETTNHYDYDHTGYTDFATSSECFACKCQDCKAKHDGVINAINALTAAVKKMTSKRGVIPSKRISYPYTPLEIKVDVTVEATAEQHNTKVDIPSVASMEEEKVEPVCLENGRITHLKEEVSRNEKFLTNIIKGFSIPTGLPWHLVDEVYIPINCGDKFYWVLAVVIPKERCIGVYDSMS